MRPDIISAQLGGVANLSLMAEIRPGFVEAFETFTYARRLGSLLKALNAARQVVRESTLSPAPFPDAVGKLNIIQSFRYNIVPPDPELRGTPDAFGPMNRLGKQWLLLNVTFDGGWEPYMRVIYRDIGPLLDAILCNCIGYPGALKSDFDQYARWVRDHEVPQGLFYTESAMPLEDQRYLSEVAKIQLAETTADAADRKIAGFAMKPAPQLAQEALVAAKKNPAPAIGPGLKSLKGLYALSRLYPPNREEEHFILIRFAQLVLEGLHQLVSDPQIANAPALKPAFDAFESELAWLKTKCKVAYNGARLAPLAYRAGDIQGGILKGYPNITHGALVLLQVCKAKAALAFLESLATKVSTAATEGAPGHLYCNVALSVPGLRALGASPGTIARFPQEVVEGMESRAGLLGDVHANHPDHWRRPMRNWSKGALQATGPRIDLAAVHIVLQYRLSGAGEAGELHSRIAGEIVRLERSESDAVRVLSVQPMRRFPNDKDVSRGHFEMADGISQPNPVDPPPKVPDGAPRWRGDDVGRGEILLGYPGDRGGGTFPSEADGLLDNGSFLALRKLRQRLDVLGEVVDRAAPTEAARAALRARMMGRTADGDPLLPGAQGKGNSFDYADDPQGQQCPFQSHARRANPRNIAPMPRILRQGMSYGLPLTQGGGIADDRGVVFMAYSGSIAEQFEMLQRWIAGGNSSGVLSAYSDPFLGVPAPGESRSFRYLDDKGRVVRVDLGTRPIVELQWGAYLFVPSIHALAHFGTLLEADKAARDLPKGKKAPPPTDRRLETWRNRLEDPSKRDEAWQVVRAQRGGRLRTDYGELVGTSRAVREVFRDDGSTYSVCGYGHRFDATVGGGFLGVDPIANDLFERGHAKAVNEALESIGEKEAFDVAYGVTRQLLRQFARLARPKPNGQMEALVDLQILSEQVLAALCTRWFGLPDKVHMVAGGRGGDNLLDKPMCPGSFASVSRYVFAPRPSPTVEADAKQQGRLIRRAIAAYLQATPADKLTPLTSKIRQAVRESPGVQGSEPAAVDDLVARTLGGVMLGFPPTVNGNFYRVVVQTWVPQRKLWDLQTRVPPLSPKGEPSFRAVSAVLRAPLLATMAKQPVPDMVWRQTPATPGALPGDLPDPPAVPVVVGIIGAMQDKKPDPMLLFGGARRGRGKTTHACPGYGMAMGVLQGLIHAVLTVEAEALRPTPSDSIVSLINPVA